ncbi:hypothetical protein GN958_ATG01820 [Phytophthora infestans]|uniref:Condensation domain-containing protein n=1 Tax=Phytophthora infestans TaxID=4787 RepID=A0A8S9V6C3_PHYIN|nr:hypothetical protein GN958_ATG01820 [Phytophthora infestans]
MAHNTEVRSPRQVKLRGFERLTTLVDNVSMKIVHSMLVTGDVNTLLRFLPTALMKTFNMHHRMRVLQVQSQYFTAEVQEPLTVDDISSRNLLRVQSFSQTTEGSFEHWQRYVADECNVGFDRYTQLPFFLTVWIDEKAEHARLMLFSDHYMSDGYSGMVIFNDILEHITSLAAQNPSTADQQVQEFPLRPSFYDMWLSKKPLSKAVMKGVISLLGKTIYWSEMKKFHPVLPARADQHDLVVPPVSNPTSASFAEGNPSSMNKALMKLEEDSVGAYVAFADLGSLANEGVNLKTTKFWDLARRVKSEIDSKVRQTMLLAAVPIILDQRVNAKIQPSFAKALNIQHSQTSDANLSNVGRYPFAKEHSLLSDSGKESNLKVKTLHVYYSSLGSIIGSLGVVGRIILLLDGTQVRG